MPTIHVPRSRAASCALALLTSCVFMLQACSEAPSGPPRLELIVLSGAEDGPAQGSFAPDTPKLFVAADLVDAGPGTTIRAAWIAVETDAAPANYEIDSSELEASTGMNAVDFSLSMPDAGWPVGSYRVDLSIDGQAAQSVPFSIAE